MLVLINNLLFSLYIVSDLSYIFIYIYIYINIYDRSLRIYKENNKLLINTNNVILINYYINLSKKLVLPKIRTRRKSFCLTNKAPEIWNALPASFHKLMNKKTFKKIINYLLPLLIS